jgi:hypothetical protein
MSHFDRRFLLARYATGGVVVDLESGNYYRLNPSATLVCEAMREGGDATERVAAQLGASRVEAARLLADLGAGLAAPAVRGTPQGSYHFHPAVGGYVLHHGARTVLEINSADLVVRLPSGGDLPRESQLDLYMRALAPKLLFQRGVTVLHASACLVERKLIAFAGVSGSGKTTTVRAFANAGSRLVSEDLVVLAPGNGIPRALLNAETFIQTWARETAARLLVAWPKGVSYTNLWDAIGGPAEPVQTILFLDKSRRVGDQIITRRLDEPDALVELMTHDFLGALEPEAWRRFFDSAVELLGTIRAEEATTPDGVGRLPFAVAAYIAKTAS